MMKKLWFCEFFVGKISTIRDNLAATNNSSSDNCDTMRADIEFDGASDHVRFQISFLKSSPSCISGEVCLFLNKYLETFHDERHSSFAP
jgi:hypothetical protein